MNWMKRWREGRNTKAGVPLVALTDPGGAAWGGRDGPALTRDGYMRNAVAYRCVRMVAEAAASMPLATASEAARQLLRRPAPETVSRSS